MKIEERKRMGKTITKSSLIHILTEKPLSMMEICREYCKISGKDLSRAKDYCHQVSLKLDELKSDGVIEVAERDSEQWNKFLGIRDDPSLNPRVDKLFFLKSDFIIPKEEDWAGVEGYIEDDMKRAFIGFLKYSKAAQFVINSLIDKRKTREFIAEMGKPIPVDENELTPETKMYVSDIFEQVKPILEAIFEGKRSQEAKIYIEKIDSDYNLQKIKEFAAKNKAIFLRFIEDAKKYYKSAKQVKIASRGGKLIK